MKKTLFLMALLLVMSGCSFKNFVGKKNSSSGSGQVKTEKRQVGDFTAVEISGAYQVEIVAQKEPSVEIEGDDNLLPLVRTEVKDGTLHIYSDRGFNSRKAIRVRVTAREIESITSTGANDVSLNGVKNETLVIETSGASKIEAIGETRTLELEMSGASKVNTRDLRAERVKVSSSGAGHANVYATEEVNADVSGASSVIYYGEPKVVNKDVSGAGSVNKGAEDKS